MANIYDIKTKLFSQNQIMERVDAKTDQVFTAQPFRVRAYPIYVLAIVVTVACQFASGVTEVYMLFNWLSSFNLFITIGLVSIAVLAIEVPKRWGANEFVLNKTILGLSLLSVTQILSVYISYSGAKALPKEIIQKPVMITPVLIDVANLSLDYDTKIKDKQTEIDKYFERFKKPNETTGGWRLSSSDKVRLPYNELLTSKNNLEDEKRTQVSLADSTNKQALQKAEEDYQEAMTNYNKKVANDSDIYGWVSLSIELLFLLAFGVMHYYLKRSDNEKNALRNETANANVTDERSIDTSVRKNERSTGVTNETPHHATLVAKQNTKPATFKDYNNSYTISCQVCNSKVSTTKENTKYCSSACRSKAYRLRNQA